MATRALTYTERDVILTRAIARLQDVRKENSMATRAHQDYMAQGYSSLSQRNRLDGFDTACDDLHTEASYQLTELEYTPAIIAKVGCPSGYSALTIYGDDDATNPKHFIANGGSPFDGFAVGDKVTVSGATDTNKNGVFTISAKTSDNDFTVTESIGNGNEGPTLAVEIQLYEKA